MMGDAPLNSLLIAALVGAIVLILGRLHSYYLAKMPGIQN